MARNDSYSEEAAKASPFNLMPTELAAKGKKRIEDFANAQTELINSFQESNRQWVGRAQAEANFASDFVSKLTSARSIPEAITACQQWSSDRIERMADDSRRLVADAQKIMETGARLVSNSWWPYGQSGGSSI